MADDTRRLLERSLEMADDTRTYQFTLFVNVEPGHPAFDDPEWAADAAWGTLTNEYGLRAIFTDIKDVKPPLAL